MKRVRAPSPQTRAVLSALLDESTEGTHGYEIIKKTDIRSGTLYPILMRLTEQGYLETEWQAPSAPGRPPRQVYRLTQDGIAYARQNLPGPQQRSLPSTGPATA